MLVRHAVTAQTGPMLSGRTPGIDLNDRGREQVTVDPYDWNDGAVRAWERAGFVEISRHEPDEEHAAAWILMEFRD